VFPPHPKPDDTPPPPQQKSSESRPPISIEQWIENLKCADRAFYNQQALEVWSIAKTMDGLIPGFWNRFMTNRQIALKQFMQQKRKTASHEPEVKLKGDE
jgi:hypothetical protein